jgi:thiamine-phosphate pyrophosphorylase
MKAIPRTPDYLRLYVITDRLLSRGRSHAEVVRKAIDGGATCIQLREKDASSRKLYLLACELRAITREKGAIFIINDRLDIALAVGADGVHLGQDDLPVDAVRGITPPEMILGVSVENARQAREAQAMGASYLGAGAVFATATKADAGEPIGLQAIADICREVDIPVVGIGGINVHNTGQVIKAGAAGVAVISAVVAADDITLAAGKIARVIKKAQRPPD